MTFPILTALFLLAFFFGRLKKRRLAFGFGLGGVVFLFAVGSGAVPSLLLKNLQNTPSLKSVAWQKRNAIVVLGGGAIRTGVDGGAELGIFNYSRLIEAARLYWDCRKSSGDCVIIPSGADPHHTGVSEAELMQRGLLKLGIDSSQIILEDQSLNTYKNAEYSTQILRDRKTETVALVTSGIHLRRSLLYFSYFGMSPLAAPSDHLEAGHSGWLPSAYSFFLTDFALHEYVGILRLHVYDFMGWNRVKG